MNVDILLIDTMWMDLKGILLNEKNTVSRGFKLYDSTYITFLK